MAASIAVNFSSNGAEMYITGTGFASAEEVMLYINGKQSNVIPANSNGDFTGQLRAQGLSAATYTVKALGNTSGLNATTTYQVL